MLRLRLTRRPQPARLVSLAAVALVAIAPAATSSRGWVDGVDRWAIAPARTAVVGYHSLHALRQALREHHGTLVRAIPALGLAEISPSAQPRYFASATVDLPGIDYVEPPVVRHENADPALQPASTSIPGGIPEWQYFATRVNEVPAFVLRAASRLTIAVIDTGADLRAPDIAAKSPVTFSVIPTAGCARPSPPWSPTGRSRCKRSQGATGKRLPPRRRIPPAASPGRSGSSRVSTGCARFAGDSTLRPALSRSLSVTVT